MPYVELHCHSAYSFLDGASLPEELAVRAAELGYPALGLTDHDGVGGAMEHVHACRGLGLRGLAGAEITVGSSTADPDRETTASRGSWSHGRGSTHPPHLDPASAPPGGFHVTVLVAEPVGWRNLCRLLTIAHRHTRDGPQRSALPPAVSLAELEAHAEGLICLSGCARDGALARPLEAGQGAIAEARGRRLLGAFGPERFRVELQRPLWRRDRARNRALAQLAERLGVPTVATGNVHAHSPARARLQDALSAVRLGGGLDQTEPRRRGNHAHLLLDPTAAAARFADHPEAVAETERIAERLEFDLASDLGYRYPGAEDEHADRDLAELCRQRFAGRYDGTPERAEAEDRLAEELRLIRELGLSGFFLLHHDLLELAAEVAVEVRGPSAARRLLPPGRGRGSSVSSVVCYLTGLSHVDPVRNQLFLGRFLNDEITALPDIDLDFPRDVREVLIPRIHERYGHERSALVAAVNCYRSRGAVRDLGKALGLPAGEIERVARSVEIHADPAQVARDVASAIGAERAASGRWKWLIELAREAWQLPRHLSQHPGGMVLATQPLVDVCPVQPAAMEGRQLVQWDKDSCADAGFLKIDLLGLGMLSAIERCVDEIARVRGEHVDLSRIALDDPEVFAAIQRAETTGVFQIESRAQMQMLPRTLPADLDDLTVQVALVRPGPIQGGAVHPYIERRKRLRADPGYQVPYEHPSLEPILRDTLGAIVFQDQVLEVSMALAGFSPGEAEGLRRVMSKRRSEEAMRAYRERFIDGAVARGVERDVAERVFDQVKGFSGFGFPKSHSVAFGLLAYQSTWLRVHYGPELLCALLNEQPMGFYPPDALAHEAQRRGFTVRPPEINASEVLCHAEPMAQAADPAVRIGLGYIDGAREQEIRALVTERERGGTYGSLPELASRSGAGRQTLERLAWSGACDTLVAGLGDLQGAERERAARRRALWEIGTLATARRRDAGEQLALPLDAAPAPALAPLNRWERVVADYESTGVTLGDHPMTLLRGELPAHAVTTAALDEIADSTPVTLAGLVVARQRPSTAKGVVFMLLEDETGQVNVVVLPPVYERHRLTVRTEPFVSIAGTLERREGTINIIARRIGGLDRPDLPRAEVRHIEPPAHRRPEPATSADEQELPAAAGAEGLRPAAAGGADLRAVAPTGHSWGRRGR